MGDVTRIGPKADVPEWERKLLKNVEAVRREAATLRDKYAMAVWTGVLANPNVIGRRNVRHGLTVTDETELVVDDDLVDWVASLLDEIMQERNEFEGHGEP